MTKSAASIAFRVELTARAARDLDALYLQKNAAASTAAAVWFNGLEKAVGGLAFHSARGAPAPETRKLKRHLRNLLYGTRPNIYRVIYEINDSSRTVWVLTIRHGARRAVGTADLGRRVP